MHPDSGSTPNKAHHNNTWFGVPVLQPTVIPQKFCGSNNHFAVSHLLLYETATPTSEKDINFKSKMALLWKTLPKSECSLVSYIAQWFSNWLLQERKKSVHNLSPCFVETKPNSMDKCRILSRKRHTHTHTQTKKSGKQ